MEWQVVKGPTEKINAIKNIDGSQLQNPILQHACSDRKTHDPPNQLIKQGELSMRDQRNLG